ncbi:MAG TPA: hypothetical protein VK470_13870 [Bacteroidota bacterium]|nr:hypothetical protein [Bacteroidota bacterium]
MTINLDQLIELVVRETLKELTRLGVDVSEEMTVAPDPVSGMTPVQTRVSSNLSKYKLPAQTRVSIDLSKYKTPVLTEAQVNALDERIVEIEIPPGTVITPGARDLIKRRKLLIANPQLRS